MNSREYIHKLSQHLKKLPQNERNDAIAYYTEYFYDAGEQREQEIIASLGSPKQLAGSIRADAALRAYEEGEPKVRRGLSAVWIALLGVMAAPIALPLAIAVFVIALAILIVIFAVFLSFFITGIALSASGLAVFVASFVLIFQNPITAMFYLGSSFILAGLGLLLTYAVSVLFKKCIGAMARLAARGRHKKRSKGVAQPQFQSSTLSSETEESEEEYHA